MKKKTIISFLLLYVLLSFWLKENYFVIYFSIINPCIWFIFILILYFYKRKNKIVIPQRKKEFYYTLAFSILYLLFSFSIGFFSGFTKSPYPYNFPSILKNLISKMIPMIGIEQLRQFFLSYNSQKKKGSILLTFLILLLELDNNTILSLWKQKKELFEYCCSTILPTIACNCFYTYLTLRKINVLFLRLFLSIFFFTLPIFPNVDWFIIGSLQIVFPIGMYFFLQLFFPKKRKKRKEKFPKFTYGITILLSSLFLTFMLGVFPYEPIAILSNSMAPSIKRGDVIIFKKTKKKKNLKNNTILIYHMNNQIIAHRIVNRIDDDDTVFYQTKGDANKKKDSFLVPFDKVEGVYIFHLKYIGYPSIWLNNYFNKEKN